jgi:hypothetical protein
MIWLRWVFSPVGRWLATIGAALSILLAAYLKGRREGKEALEQDQARERERRAKNAIQADDAVRRDIAAGGLLKNDGHRRD